MMPWFTRWFDWRPAVAWEPDNTAIPVTPNEVVVLVQALSERARLQRIHRPDVHGPEGAASLMRRAGVASAYGHSTVPVLVYELPHYDTALDDLRQWASHNMLTRRFERLVLRMHALAGAAKVKGWTAVYDATGTHWPVEPAPIGDLPQLEGGEP